jgi:hypothetical protein
VAERNDLKRAVLAERRKLPALRALRERIAQNRVERDDLALLRALVSEAIAQAEPGQEWVTIEVSPQRDEAMVRRTSGDVEVDGSTSKIPRR